MSLELVPLKLAEANELVRRWHRHHKPVVGHRFSIGVAEDGEMVGAAIVGRPVARALDDGRTAEVLRCVTNGHKNACSILYAACWRAWRAMGGHRLITYVLASESGGSLKASGWKELYATKPEPNGWNRPNRVRPRTEYDSIAKTLWEAS